jgi:hypothetical protein
VIRIGIERRRSRSVFVSEKKTEGTQKQFKGGTIMGKEQNTKKEVKKEPAKSMKEKKAAKKAKKEDKKGQMP